MRRLRTSFRPLTAAVVGVLATAALAAPVRAAPPYSLEERAAAIASPSLVFIDVRLEGYLRVRTTGALVTDAPVSVHRYCSGFVAGADGHVVMPSHCLLPSRAVLRSLAAGVIADQAIEAKTLTQEQREAFVDQTTRTTDFTGTTLETPPTTTVSGQLFLGTADPQTSTAIPGQVVQSQPIDGGDLTLIKLDRGGLPVAQVNPTPPTPGASVAQIGFATGDPNAKPQTFTAKWRAAKVVGQHGTATPPQYRLDGHLGGASHGGMVVDSTGSVVGMITGDLTGSDRTNRLGSDPTAILALLSTAGVNTQLTATDRAYRTGLDAYFGGHYSEAIRNLDQVIAAQANHLPALTFRRQASERLAIEGDEAAGFPLWPLIVAGVAILVAITLAVLVLMLLRRLRVREPVLTRYEPYPPARALPAAPIPIAATPAPSPPVPSPPVPSPPISSPPVMPTTVSANEPWSVPVSPGGVDFSAPLRGPGAQRSVPVTPPPPPMPASQQASQTVWPEEQTAAWPAVTVWRNQSDEPVPPPSPAPSAWAPAPPPRQPQEQPPDGRPAPG